jgi:hypothetical protein
MPKELDRKVALAMGQRVVQHPQGGWSMTRSDGSFTFRQHGAERLAWESCPRYSTDPEQIGAMLEWAHANCEEVSLEKVAAPYHWKADLLHDGGLCFGYAGEPLNDVNGGPQLALASAIAATTTERSAQ